MPTYTYACTDCDNRFDTVQAFSDESLSACPECAGRLRKLFGKVGVVFKGSGFYRNDSREPSKSTSDDAGTSSESGSSSSEKSDKTEKSEKSEKPSTSTSKDSGSSSTTTSSTPAAAGSSS